MLDWSALLTTHFWFSSQPGPFLLVAMEFLLVVFASCLVVGIIFHLIARTKKSDPLIFKLLKKIQALFATLGVVGLIILFFIWQQIPYLSSRYWLVVWLIMAVIWIVFIFKFAIFEMPKRRGELEEKAKLEKYLPKKNKKNRKK